MLPVLRSDHGETRLTRERRGDRRARLYGLVYLGIAALLAVTHDQIVKLPAGRAAHDLEQVTLAGMLVLGMLGGLLLVEGRRLLEDAYARAWERERRTAAEAILGSAKPVTELSSVLLWSLPLDSDALDTRSGVALLLARRAISAAGCTSDGGTTASSSRQLPG